jgi:hypothetical protein
MVVTLDTAANEAWNDDLDAQDGDHRESVNYGDGNDSAVTQSSRGTEW